MIVFLLISVLLSNMANCQLKQGSTDIRPHPPVKSQSKVFDLPKFAPTARIIRLSSSFRRKTHKKSDDSSLFRDAAGPFDNFEAFDLTSSGEANSPRKKSMSGRQSRKPGNIDDFFPMSS